MTLKTIAAKLAEARTTGKQVELDWPAPDMAGAMAIQEQAVAAFGGEIAGWKAGATNPAALQAMGLDESFLGPVPASVVFGDGTTLEKRDTVMAVEPEIAFRMKRDISALDGNVDQQSVLEAIGSCHLALEVIGRCTTSPAWQNGLGLTMEFAGNSALILGIEVANWREIDLANIAVKGLADGIVEQEGNTSNVMTSPLISLTWVINTLARYGKSVNAGDIISTGTCTVPVAAKSGGTVSASFDGLGEVSVAFS